MPRDKVWVSCCQDVSKVTLLSSTSLRYLPTSLSLSSILLLFHNLLLRPLTQLHLPLYPFVSPTHHLAFLNHSTVIMRGLVSLTLLPMLASSAPTFNTDTIHQDSAPLISSTNSVEVPDSYIVVFKKHVSDKAASDHHSWVQDIHAAGEIERMELRKRSQFPISTDIFEGLKHTYKIGAGFLGYSGHFDDSVIEKVRKHPDVSSIHPILVNLCVCLLQTIRPHPK